MAGKHKLAVVSVKGQDRALFPDGERQHLDVGQAPRDLCDSEDVMPSLAEVGDRRCREVFVGKQSRSHPTLPIATYSSSFIISATNPNTA
jgi:hypothetical protein